MSQDQYGKSGVNALMPPQQYDARLCVPKPCEPNPKLPQVIQAIKDLAEAVDRMEKEFGMLHDKLSIVTACPPPPEPVTGMGIQNVPQVELAMSINANADRVRMLQRAMRSLGERIEL